MPGNYNNGEAYDYWLMKTDNSFNKIWSKNFGGSNACGDLDCSNFKGNLLIKDSNLYVFIKNVVPETLPDFDINCGALGPEYTDAWIVGFDLNTNISNPIEFLNSYTIYPNPATNEIVIRPSLLSSEKSIVIISSMEGKDILKKEFTENSELQIDATKISTGIYIINIINENILNFRSKIVIF